MHACRHIVCLCKGVSSTSAGVYIDMCVSKVVCVCVCVSSLSKKNKDSPPISGRPLEQSRWSTLRDIPLPKKWPDYPPSQKPKAATPNSQVTLINN